MTNDSLKTETDALEREIFDSEAFIAESQFYADYFRAKKIASDAIANLEAEEKRLTKLADDAIAKYPLL